MRTPPWIIITFTLLGGGLLYGAYEGAAAGEWVAAGICAVLGGVVLRGIWQELRW